MSFFYALTWIAVNTYSTACPQADPGAEYGLWSAPTMTLALCTYSDTTVMTRGFTERAQVDTFIAKAPPGCLAWKIDSMQVDTSQAFRQFVWNKGRQAQARNKWLADIFERQPSDEDWELINDLNGSHLGGAVIDTSTNPGAGRHPDAGTR